jgi:trans-aconitate methyltransferase
MTDTTSAEFFDQKYRANPDPWDFAHSDYERTRYDAIIAALGNKHYARAFEPGCSVGELTAKLAARCGHVDAMDISATAVLHAKERCSQLLNVDIRTGTLSHHTPHIQYDLIVFSEIGYYFDSTSLRELADILLSRLTTHGTLLAAHWLGTSKDHILSGDRVHEILGELSNLKLDRSERHANFRLDRWLRT